MYEFKYEKDGMKVSFSNDTEHVYTEYVDVEIDNPDGSYEFRQDYMEPGIRFYIQSKIDVMRMLNPDDHDTVQKIGNLICELYYDLIK